MTAEPALAEVTVEVLRPDSLSAGGPLRPDGIVELNLGTDELAEIRAALLPNVLAENLHLGPRPLPPTSGLLRCEREALDLLLDEPAQVDALLLFAFGLEVDAVDETALRALSGAPVLHWRVRAAWGAQTSRSCEVVDAGAAGAWRVVELDDELGGGLLLGPVATTEIWRRLSTVLPVAAEVGDG